MGDELPKDLTEGETRFVNQMIKDEPQWINWVKKINRREVVQPRLLVVGKYRIYSIKRNKMGRKQIVREGHIFDLKEIFSDDLDKVVLSFTTFKIVAQAQHLGVELPKVILQCFQKISFTFSEAASPKLMLEPVGSLTPVVAALRHNTYFTALALHEKSRKEAVSAIADILQHNTTITAIDISGVEAEDGWAQLGEAFKNNLRNSLLDLNMTSNSIGEKGIVPLTIGLAAISHPMSSLLISDAELQPKGSALLFRTLASNMQLSNTLCEIDTSKNLLANAGSTALADWILQLNEVQPGNADKKYLRKIMCSSVQLEVVPVVDAIKTALPNTIEELDLSDNKFEESGNQILLALISRSYSLTNLNLSGCELTGKMIKDVLGAISQSSMSNVALDFSRNDLSQELGPLPFAKSIEDCSRIHTLILSELNLKRELLLSLIKAVGANKTLKGIDLSGNFKHGKSESVMEAIASEVLSHPTLIYLVVAGRKENYAGKEIIPLFKVVGADSKLVELDVRDNFFTDDGARALFDILRDNSYLKILHFDGNNIGWAGCQALRRCMNVNRSLTALHYPKKDMTRIMANSRDKDRGTTQDKLRELFNGVAAVCASNKILQGNIPYETPNRPLTVQLSNYPPRQSVYSPQNYNKQPVYNSTSASYPSPATSYSPLIYSSPPPLTTSSDASNILFASSPDMSYPSTDTTRNLPPVEQSVLPLSSIPPPSTLPTSPFTTQPEFNHGGYLNADDGEFEDLTTPSHNRYSRVPIPHLIYHNVK